MPEDSNIKKKKKNMKICLLGVSFDTGNMGVSALAESSIKIILNRWPDAEITLLGMAAVDCEQRLEISGREVRVRILHLRFCKNVFLRSHFGVLLLNALLLRLLPWRKVRNLLCRLNPYVEMFLETDMAFDLTGGDSFSDIYGMRRFLKFGFLQKWIIKQFGKELILLPQTYGPYRRPVTRMMARAVLKRASAVYVRDRSDVEYVRGLLRDQDVNGRVRFVPDVAFVLDPHKPDHVDVGALDEVRTEDSIVVGLNISGLLFSGGYTHANMFSLKVNYRELIYSMVDFLMKDKRVLVLLVPHVFTPNWKVEDDPGACRNVYRRLSEKYTNRMFLTQGWYNHNDIKYVIGLCDFFIGSRMHACIAALSQSIPAVGIAYSKKFQGVFESIGLERCVADAYRCKRDELIAIVGAAFERRDQIRTHLNKVIPEVQENIMNMFEVESASQVVKKQLRACDAADEKRRYPKGT